MIAQASASKKIAGKRVRHCLALFLLLLASGCASIPEHVSLIEDLAAAVELSTAPFYPQERYQCGPAALLTVLEHSGAEMSLNSLTEQVYIPERQGSLQTELIAATRTAERVPYIIDGSISAIHEELLAGRPVLVLQNLGVKWWPRWHYAVVIGIDPENRDVYLRSGTERRHRTALTTFLRTWRRGEYWAFVALRPGELPANPDAMRYFEAVADLEATGHVASSRTSWEAAANHWPNEWVAIFGLANAEYAAKNFADAEILFGRLLELDSQQHVARNNLALTLSHLGKHAEAIKQIELVLRDADPDSGLYEEYRATRRQINSAAGPDQQR